MPRSPLPAELEQIECLLASVPGAQPSAALRQRVLGEVHEELRHCLMHRLRAELVRQKRRANRCLAATCAAMLLMAVGLSLGVMHAAGVRLKPPAAAPSVAAVAWQLQQLAPQMSEKDLLVQAALRQVGPQSGCGDLLKNVFTDTKSHDH